MPTVLIDFMLTEDEALRLLLRRLDEVAKLQDQLQTERFTVETGSALAGDRQKLYGYPADHFVTRNLSAGCDNLDAMRRLIIDAQVFHSTAPFTLIRTAIELSAWSVWLLEPHSRAERIRRVVTVAHAEARTADQARQGDGDVLELIPALGVDLGEIAGFAEQLDDFRAGSKEVLTEWREKFSTALESVGLPGKMPNCTITGCFEDLAEVMPEARWCLSQWRLTSGMVHGRFWPRTTVNEWGEEVRNEHGDSSVSLTASYASAFAATTAAAFLMSKTVELLDCRRVAHY